MANRAALISHSSDLGIKAGKAKLKVQMKLQWKGTNSINHCAEHPVVYKKVHNILVFAGQREKGNL